MLYTCSLNSGSNGNCYYIGSDDEAVLIDAGLTCKETERRMKESQLDILKVKAIFISHEHSDHIKGIETLASKFKLPVYITQSTFTSGKLKIENDLVHNFNTNESISIGNLSVKAFSKKHDASDPHSFTINGNGVTVGVFTDIGEVCTNTIENFLICNAVFLESNYDEEMLENGSYPYFLKKRITGGNGHLSNNQALELFIKFKSPFLSHIFLSHLSKDNNCPDLAKNLFQKFAGKVNISVASRNCCSEVFSISTKNTESRIKIKPCYIQTSLF